MKYEILSATKLPRLEDKVNSYIRDGWKPLGGVSVVAVPSTRDHDKYELVCQAMTKEA